MKDFHVSAAVIGLMSSFQFFAYAGFQIPVGLLSDRYGPNRFLILGTILTGIGCIIYNFSPNEYVLIFSRFLVGIGDSMIFVNLVIILSQWFKANEFVKLLGVISLFSSIGSLMATVPFSVWITFAGWRTPFLTIGIILVLLSYFLYTVLVLKPKTIFKDDIELKKKNAKNRESVWVILRRTISTRQAWATFLCHFGLVGAYVGFIGSWGVPYGIHVLDLSRSAASQLMMYGLFGAILGGPLISWITSRLGVMKKFIPLFTSLPFKLGRISSVRCEPFICPSSHFVFSHRFWKWCKCLDFCSGAEIVSYRRGRGCDRILQYGRIYKCCFVTDCFRKSTRFFPQDSINIGYHYGFIIPVLFSLMGVVGALMIKEEKTEEKIVLNAL